MDFVGVLNRISDMLDNISAIVTGAEGTSENISSFAGSMAQVAYYITRILKYLKDLWGIFLVGGGAIFLVVVLIIFVITFLLFYIYRGIPLHCLNRKAGRKTAWWAWIPFFSGFALCDIPGDKPLAMFGKKRPIKNRMMGYFWIYFCSILFPFLLRIVNLVLGILPLGGIGDFFVDLTSVGFYILWSFVINCFMTRCTYLLLRDGLDCFSANKKRNRTLALIAATLDVFIFFGAEICQSLVLYSVIRKAYIPTECESEILVVEEATEVLALTQGEVKEASLIES